VEHAADGLGGNFTETSRRLLARLAPEKDTQQSFKVQEYVFNCVKHDDITYLAMTNEEFDRATCFTFLQNIRRRFSPRYGPHAESAISYAFNSEFEPIIKTELERLPGGSGEKDTLVRINSKVKELKGVMADNIGIVLRRGEKVDLLVQKSEVLDVNAGAFKKNATALHRAMYWKNMKTYLTMGGMAAGVMYIFLSSVCGGFSLPYCT